MSVIEATPEIEITPEPAVSEALPPASPEKEQEYESVIAVLLERQRNGYRRGTDNDGLRVGLAFDMGGLSAIVGVAMARKLEVAGLLKCVDAFYGLSAGGLNAAYAAAGQIKDGKALYGKVNPDHDLVDYKRLLPGGRPLMDIDILRMAVTEAYPLNLMKITGQDGVPVVIGLTDMDDPKQRGTVVKSTDFDHEHRAEFMDKLLMGCKYPIATGEPIKDKNGNKHTDGGMAFVSAIDLAFRDKCTHVLSLANSPRSTKRSLSQKIAGAVLAKAGQKYIEWHGEKVEVPFEESWQYKLLHPFSSANNYLLETLALGSDSTDWHYNEFERIAQRRNSWPYMLTEEFYKDEWLNRWVERIYPPDIPELPGMLTMDKKKLQTGIRGGRLAIREALKKAAKSKV